MSYVIKEYSGVTPRGRKPASRFAVIAGHPQIRLFGKRDNCARQCLVEAGWDGLTPMTGESNRTQKIFARLITPFTNLRP